MTLPDQLLLSDLLNHTVRCDLGLDHGPGLMAWMHPPVHRLLGWVSRPSALRMSREVWRLDQCCGLTDQQVFVRGEPASTDLVILEQLPTLMVPRCWIATTNALEQLSILSLNRQPVRFATI